MVWLGLLLLAVATVPILVGMAHWCWAVRRPAPTDSGRVSLVLPLAPGADIAGLRQALDAQDLSPRRLILTVRDAADAPPGAVIAGPASSRGQKSHNLLAALERIDGDDEVVLFLDADIIPPPWWLGFLAQPILAGERDVVSGFRWSQPRGPVAQLVAWLDRGWALTARVPGMNVCWGGSLAFAPAALPSIRRGLSHGVSDDLGIAAAARADGLRVLVRGAALVPSPLASAGALEFWTRQLRIIRFYRPGLWWAQIVHSHFVLAAWVLLWGSAWLWLAVAALAARSLAQATAARRLGFADPVPTRAWQALLGLLPLADALNLCCLWSSALGRTITWRGITYRIAPDGAATVLA